MERICSNCKYFEPPFGYLEESCRCRITGKYTGQNKSCEQYIPTSEDTYYDDYEQYGY